MDSSKDLAAVLEITSLTNQYVDREVIGVFLNFNLYYKKASTVSKLLSKLKPLGIRSHVHW